MTAARLPGTGLRVKRAGMVLASCRVHFCQAVQCRIYCTSFVMRFYASTACP